MPAAPHRSNFILKEQGTRELQELHDQSGHSKGQIVRDLIHASHLMKVVGIPQCASGMPCPYPQAHAQVQQLPPALSPPQPNPSPVNNPAGDRLPPFDARGV